MRPQRVTVGNGEASRRAGDAAERSPIDADASTQVSWMQIGGVPAAMRVLRDSVNGFAKGARSDQCAEEFELMLQRPNVGRRIWNDRSGDGRMNVADQRHAMLCDVFEHAAIVLAVRKLSRTNLDCSPSHERTLGIEGIERQSSDVRFGNERTAVRPGRIGAAMDGGAAVCGDEAEISGAQLVFVSTVLDDLHRLFVDGCGDSLQRLVAEELQRTDDRFSVRRE